MTFSAGDAAIEGLRVARRHPGALAIWALFYVGVFAVAGALIFLTMGGALLAMFRNPNAFPDPTAIQGLWGGIIVAAVVLIPALLLMSVMLSAAVFRAALRPEDKGIGFLKISGDEFRMLAVTVVFAVLALAFYAAAGGGMVLLVKTLYASNQAAGVLVAILGGIALVCVMIFFSVRLSLASVQTFAERKIRLFDSWGLTKGYFWPLFGAYFLAWLISFGVAIGLSMINSVFQMMGMSGMMAAGSNGGSAADMLSWTPLAMVGAGISMLINLIGTVLQQAILYGPQASAYRQLSPPDASKVF